MAWRWTVYHPYYLKQSWHSPLTHIIYMLHQATMCQPILPIPMPDFLLVVQYHNTTFVRRPCELIPPLQWRQNGRDCVPNHQPRDCLLNRLFRLRSKKTSKLCVSGLCAGNSPVPAQMASNAENVSIWWRHHVSKICCWRPWCTYHISVCRRSIYSEYMSKAAIEQHATQHHNISHKCAPCFSYLLLCQFSCTILSISIRVASLALR